MHPSLLSLVVAIGVFYETPHADITSTVQFKPVHDGFLLVRHPSSSDIYFSRGGTFHLDPNGRLVNDADMALLTLKQHDKPDEVSWEDMRLPVAHWQTPRASEKLTWRGNIDPYAAALRFDPRHPEVTSNMASYATVFDAQGGRHKIAVYFNASGVFNEQIVYRWMAMVDPADLQDPNAASSSMPQDGNATRPDPTTASDTNAPTATRPAGAANPNAAPAIDTLGRVGQGRIAFYRNGTLSFVGDTHITVHFAGLPQPQTLALDFGHPVDLRHNGRDGLTAFASYQAPPQVTQDGYKSRWVTMVSELDINGQLEATFSDGTSQPLDPLIMARFYNMHGMTPAPGDTYEGSDASGPPKLTVATCADMEAAVRIDHGRDGTDAGAHVVPAVGTCPWTAKAWQKIATAPGTYFVLEGDHAGQSNVYLAREVDLRLIAGEPLQEGREGLRLQATVPLVGGGGTDAPHPGGVLVPRPAELLTPKMTTSIVVTGNLDASNPPRVMDPYHLQSSANASAEVAVYDHAGAPHQVRFDFYAQGKVDIATVVHHRYLWLATFDAPSGTGNNNGRELDNSIADGMLHFNPNGMLRSPTTTQLDLPLGPGGSMVHQTIYFGEPPDVVDPNQIDPNQTSAPQAADANQVADANASGDAGQASEGPHAPASQAAADANAPAGDPNTSTSADANIILLPAPLTSVARATRLTDTYQDGWQPGLIDMQYGIDACGVLSVGLPTGERLMLGKIMVAKLSQGQHPEPLNDWLYAWPQAQEGPQVQPAACDDVVFEDLTYPKMMRAEAP